MNTPNSRCNISFSENDYYSCSSFLPVLELPPHNSSLNMTTHLNDYEAIYLQFHDLFNHHQQQQQQQYCSSSKIAKRAVDRTSKKDRHSKINTMHGPRDRRMRLSLDIARKFFNLQDLLGFDKPSQTVDWLLQNSNTAIGELEMDDEMKKGNGALLAGATTNTNTSASSCTEEVIDNSSSITGVHHHEKELEELPLICPKKKKAKKVKASSSRPMVGRESRTKARDRARERTSQKRRLITDTTTTTVIDHDKRISAIRATDEIVVFNSNVGIQNSHGLEDFNDEEYAGSNKPWEASHGARQLL